MPIIIVVPQRHIKLYIECREAQKKGNGREGALRAYERVPESEEKSENAGLNDRNPTPARERERKKGTTNVFTSRDVTTAIIKSY